MKSIIVENVSKTYRGNPIIKALNKVSFEVRDKELFGLIGPDGAGKTTLFRILTTLQLADEGKASILGDDVVKNYKLIRNKIGYMPGRFSLYQDLSIEENINFFANIYNTSIDDNYEMIKDVYEQIEPFKKRRAGNLSGGMKQKLALCCALIHKPDILFLDEPTTGVDPVSRKEFWEMLQNLKKNISILVSTPYMDEAAQCDRVALIQNGSIMAIDTPDNIVEKYPYELYAIKANNNYHLLEYLKTQSNIKSCYISGEFLHVVFNDKDTSIDFPDIEIHNIKPSIEDSFIELMKSNGNDRN